MKRTSKSLVWLVAASLCAAAGCAGVPTVPRMANSPKPSLGADQVALGRLCERSGEVEQARQLYQLVLKKNPQSAAAHHRLAVLACKQQQFEEADRHFQQALALEPNDANLLSDLGYALYLQNRLPEAEAQLRRAVEADPQLASAQNNLGLVLGQQRRYGESLAMFRRAGSEAEAYANLAFVHAQQGNLEPAEALYSQSLTHNNRLRPAAHGLLQVAQRKRLLQSRGLPNEAALAQGEPRNRPQEQAPAARVNVPPPLPQRPLPPMALAGRPAPSQPLPDLQPAAMPAEFALQPIPPQHVAVQTPAPARRRQPVEVVEVEHPRTASSPQQPLSLPQPSAPSKSLSAAPDIGSLVSESPQRQLPSHFAVGPIRHSVAQADSSDVVQVARHVEIDLNKPAPTPQPARQPTQGTIATTRKPAATKQAQTQGERPRRFPIRYADNQTASPTDGVARPETAAETVVIKTATAPQAPVDQAPAPANNDLQPAVRQNLRGDTASAVGKPQEPTGSGTALSIRTAEATSQPLAKAPAGEVDKAPVLPSTPLTSRDSTRWTGGGGYSATKVERLRRLGHEFRMARPYALAPENAGQGIDR